MATKISTIKTSQVQISGKRMRDIRPVCRILFKDSFRNISLDYNNRMFIILVVDANVSETVIKDFQKEYPMCQVEMTYSKSARK